MTSILLTLFKTQIALTGSFLMSFAIAMSNFDAEFAEEGFAEPQLEEIQPDDAGDDEE